VGLAGIPIFSNEVKLRSTHPTILMPTGTVKLLVVDRGYGFITIPKGEDVFFAHDAVPDHGFRKLAVGQTVEFEWAGKGKKSVKGPRAKVVTPAAPAAADETPSAG
jgi:cold shock protein